MKRKVIASALLFSFTALQAAPPAFAKSEKANPKSNGVMPALPVQGMQGYEAAKKAIKDASKGPSLKAELAAAASEVANAMRNAARKAEKMTPQRGDPKTEFSRSGNKRHSPKHQPPVPEVVEGWVPSSENVDPETGNTVVTYEPPAGDASGADYIIVEYDQNGTPLEAVSYTVTETFSMPDLTGMTLVRTDVLESGEKIETYGYPVYNGDTSQVTKWTVVFSAADGSFLKARLQVAETLAL